MRFLTHAAVIRCNHGGFVQFNQVQTSWRINNSQVLTIDAVEQALIVGCQQRGDGQKPCSRVVEITRGKTLEAEVDGYIPLSENLDFRTDGDPEGKAVIVSRHSNNNRRNQIPLFAAVLIFGLLLGILLGTVIISPVFGKTEAKDLQIEAKDQEINQLQQEITGLKRQQEKDRELIDLLHVPEAALRNLEGVIKRRDDLEEALENSKRQLESRRVEWDKKYKELDGRFQVCKASSAAKTKDLQAANQVQGGGAGDARALQIDPGPALEDCMKELKNCQSHKPVPNVFINYCPKGRLTTPSRIKNRNDLNGAIDAVIKMREKEIGRLMSEAQAKIQELEKTKFPQ